jgi:hypothetical protein
MLDTILLVLFLIFVFRIVIAGLQKQPGAMAGLVATAAGGAAAAQDHGNVIEITSEKHWEAELERGQKERKVVRICPIFVYTLFSF